MEPPVFRQYWVLYFDLAGFSDLIRDRGRRDQMASAYLQILKMVRHDSGPVSAVRLNQTEQPEDRMPDFIIGHTREMWRTRIQIFSDSIFFFFDGDAEGVQNPWAAPQLLFACAAEVSLRLWAAELPHRGAIAFGDCWLDPEASAIVGEAIVRAVRWEQEQEWFGVSVEPSSAGTLYEIVRGERNVPILRDVVPTKSGPIPAVCINPVYFAQAGFGGRRTSPDSTRALLAPALAGFKRAYSDAIHHANLKAISKYEQTSRFLLKCGVKPEDLRLRD
jgi:hypothetical protein